MPIYAKKVQSTDPRFHDRTGIVTTGRGLGGETVVIPIPDDVILCNGCNRNMAKGYLVYLGKRELRLDQPYDIYCPECLRKYFPKAVMEE